MEITLNNCNSIIEANLSIEIDHLNIKYGINGTGKSTISRAIELNSIDQSNLKELTPFKYIENNPDNIIPSITLTENIDTVLVFNEEYIDNFVFKEDELIKDSFEIFINNNEYKEKIKEIENIVSVIKSEFNNNESLNEIIQDLTELSGCFGRSKTGYSAAGSIGKGLGKGNKIKNIPEGLELYKDYLHSSKNTKWIKWQVDGNNFIEISEKCPYCTSPTSENKEVIQRVNTEYNAKSIEHLIKVLGVVERLSKYFHEGTKENIYRITKNKTGISKEEINYLKQVKEQIDTLNEKLINLKGITFFTLEKVDKVIDEIKSLKIKMSVIPFLNSRETQKIINPLNTCLNSVLIQAGKLQGEVNKQKNNIRKTIERYKTEINNFLKFAGYKYIVNIEEDGGKEYKMKLQHHDLSSVVKSGGQHLSYGEKNAFSLVLFMYECLSKNPDLIILDDPISSFDKNKKFAIIEMLFRGKSSLREKTVLMLTHDLEPIIDIVKILPHTFNVPMPKASFLRSRNGIVEEIPINKSDILTFSQVCIENIENIEEEIIKLIYLRRYYETINDKGNEYQLLSSLLHKKPTPTKRNGEEEINMEREDISSTTQLIKERIQEFDYNRILTRLVDSAKILEVYNNCRSDYEKLQIFRIVNDRHENDVIRKYINEVFHIESELVCQLNPCKYEIIPEFIINECDKYFSTND